MGVELESGRFAVAAGAAARLAALFPEHLTVAEETEDRLVIETVLHAPAAADGKPTFPASAADFSHSASSTTDGSTGTTSAAPADGPSDTASQAVASLRSSVRVADKAAPGTSSGAGSREGRDSATERLADGPRASDASAASAASASIAQAGSLAAMGELPAPTPRSVCAASAVMPPRLSSDDRARVAGSCATVSRYAFTAAHPLPPTARAGAAAGAELDGAAGAASVTEHVSASSGWHWSAGSTAVASQAVRRLQPSVAGQLARRLVLLRGDMWTAADDELRSLGASTGAAAACNAPGRQESVAAPAEIVVDANVPEVAKPAGGARAMPMPAMPSQFPAPQNPISHGVAHLPEAAVATTNSASTAAAGASSSRAADAETIHRPLAVLLHTELPDSVRFGAPSHSPLHQLIESLPRSSRFATYHDIQADCQWLKAAAAASTVTSSAAAASATSTAAQAVAQAVSQTAAPQPCFAQLPANVTAADVVYTSWAPRGGWHLFCWERL